MTTIDKILGYVNLICVFNAFGLTIYSLAATEVEWYKVGFWFLCMILNMAAFLSYWVNRD